MTENELLLKNVESLEEDNTRTLYQNRFNTTVFEKLTLENQQTAMKLQAAILKEILHQNELLKQMAETVKTHSDDLNSVREDITAIRGHTVGF